MEPFIDVRNVSMRFGGEKAPLTLDSISLGVQKGEFATLIGHSGCGKSTLLNLIAGLLTPSAGRILIDGVEVRAPGPDKGVVFQSPSLLPWMTCLENVHLGIKQVFGGRLSKSELKGKAEAALSLVHLAHAANKYPYELSGGMKQRVGIARALSIEPRLLLMDEPFGALDALTRASLQDELVNIVEQTRSTVVMVTHDIEEALLLSDRVYMMTNGPSARIGECADITMPKPRARLALAKDRTFSSHRAALMEFLYLKQHRVDLEAGA